MLQVSCSKFSQLSNSEFFFENLSTIDKVTICNAISSFFGPPCKCVYYYYYYYYYKSLFSHSGNLKGSSWLETANRKTQSYLAMCNRGRPEATEYWPLVCMEEGNHLGELEICYEHSNAQEEYAMRRRSLLALKELFYWYALSSFQICLWSALWLGCIVSIKYDMTLNQRNPRCLLYCKSLNKSSWLLLVQSSQTPACNRGLACISTTTLQQTDGRQHVSLDNRVFCSIDSA